MTVWNPVFTRSVPSHPDPSLKIEYEFTSTVLTFWTACSKAQPSWRRAGWVCPLLLQMPGIEEPSRGVGRRLRLGMQTLRFDNLRMPFQLEFFPVGWLSDVTLIVWEPDPPILDFDLEIDFGENQTN